MFRYSVAAAVVELLTLASLPISLTFRKIDAC